MHHLNKPWVEQGSFNVDYTSKYQTISYSHVMRTRFYNIVSAYWTDYEHRELQNGAINNSDLKNTSFLLVRWDAKRASFKVSYYAPF